MMSTEIISKLFALEFPIFIFVAWVAFLALPFASPWVLTHPSLDPVVDLST